LKALIKTAKWISRKLLPARPSEFPNSSAQIRQSLENRLGEQVTFIGDLSDGADHVTKIISTRERTYALKLPRRENDAPTLLFRQRFAFRALEGKLPLPEIHLATEYYILEDFIGGTLLHEATPGEDAEQRIFTQLGQYLKAIHKTKTEGFGPIELDGTGQFPTLKTYVKAITDRWLPKWPPLGLLSPDEFNNLHDYLQRNAHFLDSKDPVMLHGDYEDHNIMVAEGDVSGVLDFADLSSGPAALDLARPFVRHYRDGKFECLLEGYGKIDPEELEYYAVLHCVRVIPRHANLKEKQELDHALEVLLDIIHPDTSNAHRFHSQH